MTAPMSDHLDAIHFPQAVAIPSFATAFMDMMFAHAEFEEQVLDLQAAIIATPPARPSNAAVTMNTFAARLCTFVEPLTSQLLTLRRPRRPDADKGGSLGSSRDRPKRIAKLIKERPGLVEDEEAKEIDRILKAAIEPCDGRNLLAHGRWWRFDVNAKTIIIRGERKGEPEYADYTEGRILSIDGQLNALAADLYKVRREIERRRGDHDVPESA